ncbi:hypothetical protein Hanom_Chr04g00290901 [Helianthus anomalus]
MIKLTKIQSRLYKLENSPRSRDSRLHSNLLIKVFGNTGQKMFVWLGFITSLRH